VRNPERIPFILETIKKEWEKRPDMRLGQLLKNMGLNWAIEDYDFLENAHMGQKPLNIDISEFPEYWIEPNALRDFIGDIERAADELTEKKKIRLTGKYKEKRYIP